MDELVLLGASGDIGRQSLDILKYSFSYKLVGISFKSHYEKLKEYLFYFDSIKYVAIEDINSATEFISLYPQYKDKIITGSDCSIKLLSRFSSSITVLNAISGNDGLKPTLYSLKNNMDLLLANKESIVIGYSLMKGLLKNYKGRLYPIDSEHVALYKLLEKLKDKNIKQCYITASGGALRNFKKEELPYVKKEDVLKHPTWHMSNKITVDSATLVNKGYEIIETQCLFSLDNVRALICPTSLIHALIDYEENGTIKREVEYSPVDMRVSIAFSLSKGKLKAHNNSSFDQENIKRLELREIDDSFYPLFNLTLSTFKKYSHTGMIYYNAVDCIAIDAFLKSDITFMEIQQALSYTYDHMPFLEELSLDNIDDYLLKADEFASWLIKEKKWRSR